MKTFTRIQLAILGMLLAVLPAHAGTVPEPSTVIYGKVLHRAHGHEYRLTQGDLVWALEDQNGKTHTFTAELEDIRGVFSYRINIPHQALASGLATDPSVIPLRNSETRYDFKSITVNGSPARIFWSAADYLKTFQRSRAATHRIDLEIFFDLEDTDGDGLPDWWEEKHGLDWQLANANIDSSGDGWTNLQAYLNGADPNRDNRVPYLQTKEIAAYGESDNGIWLRTIDADTGPDGLFFTLVSLPDGGEFHFEDPADGPWTLAVGDTFTQADLNDGRLRFHHLDASIKETAFTLSLTDGDYDAEEYEVSISIFPPDASPEANPKSAPEWWRDENSVFEAYWGLRENVLSGEFAESVLLYMLGKNHGWTLWDQRLLTLPVTLQAEGSGSHFILGGSGNDILTGGPEDDIISGGRGSNRLRGGGGRDLFMITHTDLDTIEDFDVNYDVIDLSSLFHGKIGWLDAYLQATTAGPHTDIRFNATGTGSTFPNAVVRLENVTLTQADLNRMWSRGQLLLGAVQGFSAISITGWPSAPLEEGYSTATLIVRRDGPANQVLTVGLAISGNARNGIDYEAIPTTLTFGVGVREVPVFINPLIDNTTEGTQQLNLAIAPGQGYVTGSGASGIIQIIDAKQRFNAIARDAFAVVGDVPGFIQITRSGPVSTEVEILIQASGAIRNTDYQGVPTMLTFNSGVRTRNIAVEALGLGVLANPETNKTLTVSIRPAWDDEYLLGNNPSASILLLSETRNFEDWIQHEQLVAAGHTISESEILSMTSPRSGLNALLEYAFSYGRDLSQGVSPEDREMMRPRLFCDGEGMCFEFSKRLNDPRLRYTVERSSDLVNWRSDPKLFEPIQLNANLRAAGRVRYRVVEPDGEPMPFMRVRVERVD